MFRAICICCNKRKIHIRLKRGGQFHFCFFSTFFEPLKGHFITSNVNSVFFFKLICQEINQPQVKIISAQMRIAIRRLYFKNPIAYFKDRNIKCSAAKIKYRNFFIRFFIQTICQRCGSRFIDNPENVQSGNFSGIFCGLALTVIKICRNRNNRIGYCFAQIIFSSMFDIGQNK